MNTSRIVFFCVVLGIVIGIARCNSRQSSQTNAKPAAAPQSPANSNILVPPPQPAPAGTTSPTQGSQTQAPVDFQKVADRVSPAVIGISVFNAAGKLLRNGTGFFISDDGRFVTSWSIVDGGAHAVAQTGDGRIHNVLGILANAVPADVAVLKAEVKERVPFLAPKKATAAKGARIAAIGNGRKNAISQTSITGRRSDANSEWLDLATPLPGESLGAPVVNENGDVLGLVALQRGQGPAVNVVRLTTSFEPLYARIESRTKPAWQAAPDDSPSPPAEGPLQKPKIPLAGVRPSGTTRLIYSPTPQYPTAARQAGFQMTGTGRYQVRFSANGQVRDVRVIQSTRSATLDTAAVEALRKWKASPGEEWTANVPITFQP
jgi:TonB family protein